MSYRIDLDTKLLKLAENDHFSIRDAVQGVVIFGGIGSSKTSGSGATLAASYLKAGFGGIVCVAKKEESDLWISYCSRYRRTSSLINFDGNGACFNFIAYELSRHGVAGLNNVIDTLLKILEMTRSSGSMASRSGDEFWTNTTAQILRNTIPVLFAATGTVRIEDLLRFVRSAPQSPEQMKDPAWQQQSYFCSVFLDAADRMDNESGSHCVAYWRNDFATLDPKTRGNILISLTTTLDRFTTGWLKQTFCSGTTVVPELTFQGAIILLNMPALVKNEDGIIAQKLFKYMWQRAVLSRNGLDESQRERPVFLWMDEAQYFISPQSDAEFLSTARGSRACSVFLSQNLPGYYSMMGENGRDRAHHLLGNFATRIWHNNACAETNEWASRTIGRTLHNRGSYNRNEGTSQNSGLNMGDGSNWGSNSGSGSSFGYSSGNGSGGSWSMGSSSNHGRSQGGSDNRGVNRGHGSSQGESWGYSEQMDHLIEPAFFSRGLRTGGPANGNRASAIWYQAGRQFHASGGNALLAEFQQ